MGDYPVASRKNDFTSTPRAYAAAGAPGQVASFAVSATAIYLDLTQGISQAAKNLQISGQDPKSPTRNYLSIVADVDVGVAFGPTAASVSGANAPVLATVGTVSGSGVYTGAAGTCWVIKANAGASPTRFLLQQGVDLFVGIVATGAGKCRVYQSSPDDA